MFYDAQIAGLPDSSPLIRKVKAKSDEELRNRRSAVVEAVGSWPNWRSSTAAGPAACM